MRELEDGYFLERVNMCVCMCIYVCVCVRVCVKCAQSMSGTIKLGVLVASSCFAGPHTQMHSLLPPLSHTHTLSLYLPDSLSLSPSHTHTRTNKHTRLRILSEHVALFHFENLSSLPQPASSLRPTPACVPTVPTFLSSTRECMILMQTRTPAYMHTGISA